MYAQSEEDSVRTGVQCTESRRAASGVGRTTLSVPRNYYFKDVCEQPLAGGGEADELKRQTGSMGLLSGG